MKDLSREEKIEQEISRLEQLISKKDDEFDREQGKRCKRTFFVIWGVLFLSFLIYGRLDNIKDCLMCLAATPVMSGFIMLISYGVWFYVMNGAIRRAETIAELKGKLYAIKLSKYDKE